VLQQHRIALTKTDEKTSQARFNLAFDDGAGDHNLKAKIGGVLRSSERDFKSSQINYRTATGFTYTLDEVDVAGPSELIAGRYLLSPRIGAKQAMDFFRANRAKFTETVTAPTGNYGVTEDIYAGYAQASYQVGDLTLLGGLRYEKTKVESDAIRNTGGVLTPTSNSGSYGNWLPSAHLQWKPARDWIIRAAWTNTIGRPDYNSLAATEGLNFDGSQPTLSRGNPSLKARESEGFDLSVEFYPRDGMVSLAVFSKDIKNEIFTLSSTENLNVGRGVEPVLVSTPRNAETAKISGRGVRGPAGFHLPARALRRFRLQRQHHGAGHRVHLPDLGRPAHHRSVPAAGPDHQRVALLSARSVGGPGVAQLHRRPAGDDQRRQRQFRPVLEGPPRVRRQPVLAFRQPLHGLRRGSEPVQHRPPGSDWPGSPLPAGMGQLRPHLLGRRGSELLGFVRGPRPFDKLRMRTISDGLALEPSH
jgi:hypothetical protein